MDVHTQTDRQPAGVGTVSLSVFGGKKCMGCVQYGA